jgi:hypothetical protein
MEPTIEQLKRWKTYTYHMYDDATSLLKYSNKELAQQVVEIYCNVSEEADPLYDYMIESLVESYHLPSSVLESNKPDLTRDEAITILTKVCKAWLIEFVYHGAFARIVIPSDDYYST